MLRRSAAFEAKTRRVASCRVNAEGPSDQQSVHGLLHTWQHQHRLQQHIVCIDTGSAPNHPTHVLLSRPTLRLPLLAAPAGRRCQRPPLLGAPPG